MLAFLPVSNACTNNFFLAIYVHLCIVYLHPVAPFWDYWFPTLLNLIPVYLQAIHTDSGYCVLLTVRLKLYS
jgi:hypothetical protein